MANEDASNNALYMGAGIAGAAALGVGGYYGYKHNLHTKAWGAMQNAYGSSARMGTTAALWTGRKSIGLGLGLDKIAKSLGK